MPFLLYQKRKNKYVRILVNDSKGMYFDWGPKKDATVFETKEIADKENDKCLSANGKRLIECNIDPKGTCYFDIREDGNTRYVFNGIITNVEQIVLLEKLTNSFLW